MNYKISDKQIYDIIEVEKSLIKINSSDLSSKTKIELKQTAIVDELFYLAKKSGIKLTFGEAKQISVGKQLDTQDNPGLKLIYNYRSLMDFMKQNQQETSINMLIHMNKLLGNGILDLWECGMLRNSAAQPKTEFDFYNGNLFHNELNGFLPEKSSRTVTATKVLRFVVLSKPFIGLNDVTGLAAFSMEIMRMVENNDLLFSPIKLLDEIDLVNEIHKDIESVIEKVVNETLSKSQEIVKRIERENYDDSIRTKSKFLNLNERQLAALRYLEHNLKISRKQYMRLFSVSTMTAFRDMNQLVEQKIINVEGKGRGTYYKLER